MPIIAKVEKTQFGHIHLTMEDGSKALLVRGDLLTHIPKVGDSWPTVPEPEQSAEQRAESLRQEGIDATATPQGIKVVVLPPEPAKAAPAKSFFGKINPWR